MTPFKNQFQKNVAVIGTIFVSLVVIVITILLMDRTIKRNLVSRAETMAALLDANHILDLTGSEQDLENSTYYDLKMKLTTLRNVNADVRFVYLVKPQDTEVIFLMDSEPADSDDYSPPGQIYYETSDQFKDATFQGLSGLEIAGDRWGMWVTGYAPIIDIRTGLPVALVGVDLDFYTSYLIPILTYTSIPFFALIFLLLIIFYSRRLHQFQRESVEEKERLMHIASHEIGTPVTEMRLIAELLLEKEEVKTKPEIFSLLQEMYISLITLVRRTNNLLRASQLTTTITLPIETVDMAPLLHEAIREQEPVAEVKKIRIHKPISLPEKLLTLGHHDYLRVIFSNLIAHALYYAKINGSVQVEYKDTGAYHEITATSIGDSLTQDEVNNLFSAYYKGESLSRHTDSTGLGLFLIKRIATLYKGTVSAQAVEKGVMISVSLPKA